MEKGKGDMKENRGQGSWSWGSTFTGGARGPVFQEMGVTLSLSPSIEESGHTVELSWGARCTSIHLLVKHVLSTYSV